MVDAAAEVSVRPATPADHRLQPTSPLQTFNSSIAIYDERSFNLDLGLRRASRCIFTVTDIKHAIIVAGFLRHFNLLIDVRQQCLHNDATHLGVQGGRSVVPSMNLTILPSPSQVDIADMLRQFPSSTRPVYDEKAVNHQVLHYIDIEFPLVHAHPCRLTPENL
ncbi:uncharacterized protein [Dermacentor andersoni]|uniref:uncharacterized protein n=1 Tax=Dermacentor andersoni TaxID=34620 RepID=UPI002155C368|nr:uncharacterized protein LOC126532215 [Dermacentor andersoni]